MTEENILKIKGGRHPLQELTVPSYVANDTQLAGGSGVSDQVIGTQAADHRESPARLAQTLEHRQSASAHGPSMILVTGPNYSGKSVYLKQVALITYMAHVGRLDAPRLLYSYGKCC